MVKYSGKRLLNGLVIIDIQGYLFFVERYYLVYLLFERTAEVFMERKDPSSVLTPLNIGNLLIIYLIIFAVWQTPI